MQRRVSTATNKRAKIDAAFSMSIIAHYHDTAPDKHHTHPPALKHGTVSQDVGLDDVGEGEVEGEGERERGNESVQVAEQGWCDTCQRHSRHQH